MEETTTDVIPEVKEVAETYAQIRRESHFQISCEACALLTQAVEIRRLTAVLAGLDRPLEPPREFGQPLTAGEIDSYLKKLRKADNPS